MRHRGRPVKLMANLVFLPVADAIESGSYLLYDGALGTRGMAPMSGAVYLRISHSPSIQANSWKKNDILPTGCPPRS